MTTRAPNPSTGSRKISFNVSEQYDIQDVVGEGAYGVVWYVMLFTPLFAAFLTSRSLTSRRVEPLLMATTWFMGSSGTMWQGYVNKQFAFRYHATSLEILC